MTNPMNDPRLSSPRRGRVIAGAILLLTLLSLGVPAAAQAQSPDERDVVAVVERFFQGMQARDAAMMWSTVDSTARLVGVGTQNGVSRIRAVPMSQFINNVSNMPADRGAPIEKIFSPEVRIDGNLAQVWTFYTFQVGETFSHCGFDAFQLLRTENGWKIVNVADSRRTQNCDPPSGR